MATVTDIIRKSPHHQKRLNRRKALSDDAFRRHPYKNSGERREIAMFNKAKKLIAAVVAAATVMAAATGVMAAPSPVKAPEAPVTVKNDVAVDVSATATEVTVEAKTVAKGAFAKAAAVKTVTLDGVKTVQKQAFTGAKSLKTIKVATKNVKFKKGAFKGLKTRKMTVRVSRKLSKKAYKKVVKSLRKAGFKGKIKRYGKKK